MTQQRTDQPDNVSTQETPRPPDENVVTSDIESDVSKPGAEDQNVVAPAAAADKDGPPDSDSATDKPKPTPPKRNRSAERRIKRLSSKLSDAEAKDAENTREIQELRDQVERLESATPKAKEPMLQDFANPREYAKAYAKWEAADAEPAPKPRGKAPKPKADPPPAHRQTTPDKEIVAFQDRGKAKLGDEFLDALQEKTAVNQLMGEFMLDHDLGPEMYVHLANNPDEARKIYDSSTPRAIKAMEALAKKAAGGQLDAGEDNQGDDQVDDDQDDDADNPPAQRTKAPTPPTDTKPEGGADTPVNAESESMDDYAARRRKEEARKAGAIV